MTGRISEKTINLLTEARATLKGGITETSKNDYKAKYTTIYLAMDKNQKNEQFKKISRIFINDFLANPPINQKTINIFWLLLYKNYLKDNSVCRNEKKRIDINNIIEERSQIKEILKKLYTWGNFYYPIIGMSTKKELTESYIKEVIKKNQTEVNQLINNDSFLETLTLPSPTGMRGFEEIKLTDSWKGFKKMEEENLPPELKAKKSYSRTTFSRENIKKFLVYLILNKLKINNGKCDKTIDAKKKALEGKALDFFKNFENEILNSLGNLLVLSKFRFYMAEECEYLASILGKNAVRAARVRAHGLQSSHYHQYVAVEF